MFSFLPREPSRSHVDASIEFQHPSMHLVPATPAHLLCSRRLLPANSSSPTSPRMQPASVKPLHAQQTPTHPGITPAPAVFHQASTRTPTSTPSPMYSHSAAAHTDSPCKPVGREPTPISRPAEVDVNLLKPFPAPAGSFPNHARLRPCANCLPCTMTALKFPHSPCSWSSTQAQACP